MKRKGFTLIELLAIIVILAVIAVIATPIITGIIEDSRKAAFERSVEGIVKGTEIDVTFKLTDEGFTYNVIDGVIPELSSNMSISNAKGYNGVISYDKDVSVSYAIHNDRWCMINTNDKRTITDYNGICSLTNPYENGIIVYYDVLTGTTCNNYHIDNSKTGYNGTIDTKTSNSKFNVYRIKS